MSDHSSAVRQLATQLRATAAESFRNRAAWLRTAMRVPCSSALHWQARVIGANLFLGQDTRIEEGVRLQSGSATHLDEFIRIGDHCRIRAHSHIYAMGGSVTIGSRCSINPHCVLYGTGGLVIGDFVRIAAHAVIVAAAHNFDRLDVPIHEQGSSATGIVIEDDVWIGAGVKILDGVRIGRGSILAAGAVVAKNVDPFTIAGGVPARTMRARN